jgi:hypothetical protein
VPREELLNLWRTSSFLLLEQLSDHLKQHLLDQLAPDTAIWTWQTTSVMAGRNF